MTSVEIDYGAATDTGRVRSRNEDSYLVWMPDTADREPGAVFLVADGMGGHEAGDVASRFVVAELERAIADGQTFSEHEFDEGMRRWFTGVSRSLVHLAESRGASRGMGSTATLAALIGSRLVLGHVGDSRIYRWRKGNLEQLSLDHSFAEEQRRRGLLTEEEALHHPQRNLLTQALGVDTELDIQTAELDWQSGDRFLLCSDGLHGPVALSEIAERMDARFSPQESAEALVKQANEAGGPDNITAVVFELRGDGAPDPILAGSEPALDEDAPTDPSPADFEELDRTDPGGTAYPTQGEGDLSAKGSRRSSPPIWAWFVLAIAVIVAAFLLYGSWGGRN